MSCEFSTNPRDFVCSICLSLLIEPVSLPCKHDVCLECLKSTLELANPTCPVCRKRVQSWVRRASKTGLVNISKWQHILKEFSNLVELRRSGADPIESFDNEDRLKIVCPQGEIRKEYEFQLQKLRSEREKEEKAEEEASWPTIAQLLATDIVRRRALRQIALRDAKIAARLQSTSSNSPLASTSRGEMDISSLSTADLHDVNNLENSPPYSGYGSFSEAFSQDANLPPALLPLVEENVERQQRVTTVACLTNVRNINNEEQHTSATADSPVDMFADNDTTGNNGHFVETLAIDAPKLETGVAKSDMVSTSCAVDDGSSDDSEPDVDQSLANEGAASVIDLDCSDDSLDSEVVQKEPTKSSDRISVSDDESADGVEIVSPVVIEDSCQHEELHESRVVPDTNRNVLDESVDDSEPKSISHETVGLQVESQESQEVLSEQASEKKIVSGKDQLKHEDAPGTSTRDVLEKPETGASCDIREKGKVKRNSANKPLSKPQRSQRRMRDTQRPKNLTGAGEFERRDNAKTAGTKSAQVVDNKGKGKKRTRSSESTPEESASLSKKLKAQSSSNQDKLSKGPKSKLKDVSAKQERALKRKALCDNAKNSSSKMSKGSSEDLRSKQLRLQEARDLKMARTLNKFLNSSRNVVESKYTLRAKANTKS